MTREEAEQLRPGDRVFIEAKVEQDGTGRTMFGDGYLLVSFDGGRGRSKHMILVNTYGVIVAPEAIRKKLPTPRRKFREGDVVMTHSGKVRYVTEIDDDDIVLSAYEDGLNPEGCEEAELTLVCAAENREDRKGKS